MASPFHRALDITDRPLVTAALTAAISKAVRKGKAWTKHIYAEDAVEGLYELGDVYIIDEAYLVAYAVGCPWYSKVQVLSELLILNLRPANSLPFSVVTDFLEYKAREAGVPVMAVGTALAANDAALASLYTRNGYTAEAITLTKETYGYSLRERQEGS